MTRRARWAVLPLLVIPFLSWCDACNDKPLGTEGAPCDFREGKWTCDPGLTCEHVGEDAVCLACYCANSDYYKEGTCFEWCKTHPVSKVEAGVPRLDGTVADRAISDKTRPEARSDLPRPDRGADLRQPDRGADLRGPDRGADLTKLGCANPAATSVFTGGMVGCPGAVSWSNRATLCAAGSHVCTAAEWVAKRGTVVPKHMYWTDDELKFGSGLAGGCWASLTGGVACTAGRPMRVCSGPKDALGNTCQWTSCGFETPTPNQYFGGCNNDLTAGTLCCN